MKLKTKKRLLLFSTILVLIIDLFYTINIHLGLINLETIESTISISNNLQVTFLSICAISNFIAIIFILKDLLKYKKIIIVFNIIQFLFGNLFNIISAIFNIIIVSRKTTDVDDSVIKEKKELPILEDITKHKWYVYLLIFLFLLILCYSPITDLLPIPNNKIAVIISIVLLYIIQITLLIIPMWNEIKRDFIAFKNNFKLYLSSMIPRFGIIFVIYLFTNLFLISFVGSIPTNQSIINEWPIYISAFVAILIAPLTEELMFRGFMKKFIKNDILFVIISSLVFGGLHVTVADSISQVLFIIPYSILGLAFSLNYVKTRNIASNICLHSTWNSIAVIAMIITKLL